MQVDRNLPEKEIRLGQTLRSSEVRVNDDVNEQLNSVWFTYSDIVAGHDMGHTHPKPT